MPVASFKSFLGVAKQNPATYLTAATAVGATSIPVSGTGVPASSTIYFIDGVFSESRAVTAGGATSTLTVAATTYAHNSGTIIMWQLTASIGPVDYIPLTTFDFADTIATVEDKGVRGSNVETYNVSNVSGVSDISIGGDVFPDTFGYLLGSIFGAVDFTGGTPNVHTFAAMNTSASNGQPTPLMCFYYNGINTRLYPGMKLSELTINFDPAQLVTWTAKAKGFLSGVVANPTPSFSAITVQPAWQATLTIGGTTYTNIETCSFTITRASIDAPDTLDGNQSPYIIWAGPLTTTATVNFIAEDDTILNFYLQGTQPTVVLTLVNGTGATQVGVTVQLTKANFMTGVKYNSGSKGYVEIGGPITAVANTTDANTAGGGYSPSRVLLRNTKATGTYQ
jgi:hypothetical protein